MEQMDKESCASSKYHATATAREMFVKDWKKPRAGVGNTRNLGFRALPQLLWLLGQVTCLLLDLPFIICEMQLLPPHLSRRAAACTTEVRSRVTGPNSSSGP